MKKIEFETGKGRFVLVDRKDNLPILTFISNMYDLGLREYICKLSEITEEQASEIIGWEVSKIAKYNKLQIHSLLKSKGVHLYENPINVFTFDEDYIKHIEAEAKTFYNPYIFKIV